jgi:hypothetical protein
MYLALFCSCSFTDTFPLTIKDIDTLTIFKNHQDSLSKLVREAAADSLKNDTVIMVAENPAPDSLIAEKTASIIPKESWTICTGVFKEKKNARRMFQKMNKKNHAYVIIRDSMMIVTTGKFSTRDSALNYRKTWQLTETYVLKLKTNDRYFDAFPE